MRFQYPTKIATIIKRYKRFLVDLELDGKVITAHLANTGSMKTCWEPGWKALLTYHDDPKRKLKYSVEMIYNGQTWIGVNTSRANRIVEEALHSRAIKSLESYSLIKSEYKVGESRIDFFLSQSREEYKSQADCYLEVKSVTLKNQSDDQNSAALFPDAISIRAQKHLEELIKLKQNGSRAIIFFLIQREDVDIFRVADHIDSEYARLLVKAQKTGVEIFCYQCQLNQNEVKIEKQMPYELPILSEDNLAKLRCEELASYWEFMPMFNPQTDEDLRVKLPKDKHLIFYGGSFNPWHSGHLECLRLLNKDHNVFVIPDNNPRKKRLTKENCLIRYQALRKLVPQNIHVYPGFWAKDKANPTVSWLPKIKKPNITIALLIGFDSFATIDKWIDADKLLESLSTLYIVSRLDDTDLKETQIEKLKKSFPKLELIFLGSHEFENISSTSLRKKKKNNKK